MSAHAIKPEEHGPLGKPMADAVQACVHCGFCLAACPTYQEFGQEMDSPRGRIVLMKQVLEGQRSALERRLSPTSIVVSAAWRANPRARAAWPIAICSSPRFRAVADTRRRRNLRAPRAKNCAGGSRRKQFRSVSRTLSACARSLRSVGAQARSAGAAGAAADAGPGAGLRAAGGDATSRDAGAGANGGRASRCSRAARNRCSTRTSTSRRSRYWRATVSRSSCLQRRVAVAGSRGTRAICARRRHSRGGISRRFRPTWMRFSRTPPAAARRCTSIISSFAVRRTSRARKFSEARRGRERFLSRGSGCRETPARQRARGEVAYHDACHLANAQGVREEPRKLLRAIPGLELCELPNAHLCCGSAGTYNLDQPTTAASLGAQKAAAVTPRRARRWWRAATSAVSRSSRRT